MNKINYIPRTLIVFILSASASYAETIVSTKHETYPINGNNIHEIRQALTANGPKDKHGGTFAARTTPKFTWKYYFIESASGCSIKSADVNIEITYQMPALSNYEQLNSSDKVEWTRYSTATYQHEQGHAKLSIDTAKEIEWEAKSILPKSSCGEAARTANMLISNILNKHEHTHISYDTQTAHGITQGAMFALNK